MLQHRHPLRRFTGLCKACQYARQYSRSLPTSKGLLWCCWPEPPVKRPHWVSRCALHNAAIDTLSSRHRNPEWMNSTLECADDSIARDLFRDKSSEVNSSILNAEMMEELMLDDFSATENGLESEASAKAEENRSQTKKSERIFFEESFNGDVNLLCNYLQACLYANLYTHALNLLEFRIKTVKEQYKNVFPSRMAKEARVYDVIFSRLAAISPNTIITCNFFPDTNCVSPINVIGKLFEEMRNLNLKPSLTSYAAALEALDKCESPEIKISLCLQEMEEDGYSLDDVVKVCVRASKSAKHVMNAILRVTNYVPKTSNLDFNEEDPDQFYKLVEDIYSQKQYMPGALKLGDFTPNMFREKYFEQVNLEKGRLLQVDNVLAVKTDTKERLRKKKHLSDTLEEWRSVLLQGFRSLKAREKACHANYSKDSPGHYAVGRGGKLYPFLCLLSENTYVDIMINQLCSMMNGAESTMLTSIYLGEEVYAKFALQRMKDTGILPRLQTVYSNYVKIFSQHKLQSSTLPRHLWLQLEDAHGLTSLDEKIIPWHRYWTVSVGLRLAEVMNTAPFKPFSTSVTKVAVPAVYNCYVTTRKKQYGMTVPHPQFRMLLKDAFDKLVFESEVAPMVVPPRPWCGISKGGLLLNQVKAVRFNSVDESILTNTNTPMRITNQIFDSLNVVGSVAWRINQPILDLQVKYFRNKGCKELNIAQPPSESDPMPDISKMQPRTPDYESARKQAREIQKQRQEMYALYMEALYKFSIANKYRDEVIWFPHNIDFRGRCYPVQKHLNYMGSDVYRALFSFAQGRPLGKKGLEWLKIHCINLTEFKKHSPIKERLAYAEQVMSDILASVDDPDAEGAWWKGSDKPWQTLAACFEIAAAVRSPNPEKFVSTLPIHQDGSCNGLQHYAALGRDVLGAQQVNLSPSEMQQDVYLGVAKKAEELRRCDAQKNVEIARTLDGFIRRKVVKQTVMTTVYGVTRYGGKLQIKRQLAYLEDEFPKEQCSKAAGYLVGRVFDSITEMFSGAKSIQAWLTDLAKVLSKMGHAIHWNTPIGLLVTQPYYKTSEKYINSPVQRMTSREPTLNKPDKLRQVNGFPPNFIHSLDSTHMILTALHCYKEGVTFSSVHDCFWTHASTVDQMGKICREQFVALHSQPILNDLAEHFRKHLPPFYKEEDLSPLEQKLKFLLDNVPQQGDFDLKEVLGSTFFFS